MGDSKSSVSNSIVVDGSSLLTIRRLQVVAFLRLGALLLVQCADERYLEDLHDSVEQTVDDLETSFFIAIKSRRVPIIPRLSFLSTVLNRDVRRFEDLEWQR